MAGAAVCVTLELPDKGNTHDVSCIPTGVYHAHRRFSDANKREVFQLDNVPSRDDIEIHIGNWTTDTRGCILVGDAVASMKGRVAISDSGIAFDRFMSLANGFDEIIIEIANYHVLDLE
jgi:hypothetical protein